MVTGSWLKEKPETTNQKPETKSLNKSGKRGCYAMVSMYAFHLINDLPSESDRSG
jgi:hypothetical protein